MGAYTKIMQEFADVIYFNGSIFTLAGDDVTPVEAVATKSDKIIFVGTKEEAMKCKNDQTQLCDLQGKTMLPGLIDPHIHHALSAAFYFMTNIRADEDWGLPGIPPTTPIRTHDDFMKALREEEAKLKDPTEWLIVNGYASYFHGKIGKDELEGISTTRPIFMFQRSVHEVFVNSKAMDMLGFTEENTHGNPYINFAEGHFIESAVIQLVLPKIAPIILQGDRWQKALRSGAEYLHHNGITTVGDMMGIDGFSPDQQQQFKQIIDDPNISFRTYMISEPREIYEQKGEEAAIAYMNNLSQKDGSNVTYLKHVKMFADGAFFAQLMRIKGGYTDGHQGEWITPLDEFEKIATAFWKAGFSIHTHVNGDEGVDEMLHIFDRVKQSNTQSTSRIALHHLGCTRPDQMGKIKELGIIASILPYYLHALGDVYATHGMTPEMAHRINAEEDFVREGIVVSLHSDFPMAPSNPLYLAWCAVNRIGVLSQEPLDPELKMSVHQALRAVTINAAYTLGVEHEVGSIEVGKKADFTLLAENPYAVNPMKLKDITVLATIFNGRYFEVIQ